MLLPVRSRCAVALISLAAVLTLPGVRRPAHGQIHDFSQDQVVSGGCSDVDILRILDHGWRIFELAEDIDLPLSVIARDGNSGLSTTNWVCLMEPDWLFGILSITIL